NVAFDPSGGLWVSTDGNSLGFNDGLYSVSVSGPNRGETKLFLTVPVGAETCGPLVFADRALVNVQHPGESDTASIENPASHWPDGGSSQPRPSTVVAWKDVITGGVGSTGAGSTGAGASGGAFGSLVPWPAPVGVGGDRRRHARRVVGHRHVAVPCTLDPGLREHARDLRRLADEQRRVEAPPPDRDRQLFVDGLGEDPVSVEQTGDHRVVADGGAVDRHRLGRVPPGARAEHRHEQRPADGRPRQRRDRWTGDRGGLDDRAEQPARVAAVGVRAEEPRRGQGG